MRFILLLFFLSSCGFKPILARNSEGYRILDEVRLSKVEGRDKQKIERIILEILDTHPHSTPLYDLEVSVSYENSSQGVLKDSLITRYRVKVILNYRLINQETKDIVDKGSMYLYSSYNVEDSEFMNYISERYVFDNTLKELCEDLKNRLNIILSSQGAPLT